MVNYVPDLRVNPGAKGIGKVVENVVAEKINAVAFNAKQLCCFSYIKVAGDGLVVEP